MKERRTADRRSGLERRMEGARGYNGPERRQLKHRRIGFDRRGLLPNVCIYCGKVCGADGGWIQGDATIRTTVECRDGICGDCSMERFPQYYSKE